MAGKQALGRGIGAFFSGDGMEQAEQVLSAAALPGAAQQVLIGLIDPAQDQPRRDFDHNKLQELADSIRQHGVVQPILCVREGNRYSIVAGERRWRAARMAGLGSVPVVLGEYTHRQRKEIALVENLQRQDLNPMEEAEAVKKLMDGYDLTQEDVAERLGKSRPAVANALRLLNLPIAIREMIRAGQLSAGHARTLLGLSSPTQMAMLANEAVEKALSVRQLEARVRELTQKQKPAEKRKTPEELRPLEDALRDAFGTRATVRGTLKKGEITLRYYSREDAERIYELAQQLQSIAHTGADES